MRKLVYYIATSIDGYISAPDGDFSSFPTTMETMAAIFDHYPETCPAHLREHFDIRGDSQRFDAVIMGANTHQPAIDAGLTSAYPHLDQYVVTRRSFPADDRVTIVQGDVVKFVRTLKSETGADIWLCGGSDLAGQLVDEIDELQVKVNPVTFGEGKPLFGSPFSVRSWQLVGHEIFPGDVLFVTYRRKDAA